MDELKEQLGVSNWTDSFFRERDLRACRVSPWRERIIRLLGGAKKGEQIFILRSLPQTVTLKYRSGNRV